MRWGLRVASEGDVEDSFEDFVLRHELDLRRALVAAVGIQVGLEAASDALAYGWEHWDRIGEMENPGGYLYRVGLSRARSNRRAPVELPRVEDSRLPWVEPSLPDALAELPEKQRSALLLVHTFGYSLAEAAEMLGIAKGTVQKHIERALASLRESMGVAT